MIVTAVSLSKHVSKINGSDLQVLAYGSMILDGQLRIADIRLISSRGKTFVEMPKQPYQIACHQCGTKVPCYSRFCLSCGIKLPDLREMVPINQKTGKPMFRLDAVHPIIEDLRKSMTEAVFSEWNRGENGNNV